MERQPRTKIFNNMLDYLKWKNELLVDKIYIKELSLGVTKDGRVFIAYCGGK